VIRSRQPSDAHQLLVSVVEAVEADGEVEAILDVRVDEPVLDLRDPVARPPAATRRPPGPDEVLALVLNRARYRRLGIGAVCLTGGTADALAELATLTHRATSPDLYDLLREAAARHRLTTDSV